MPAVVTTGVRGLARGAGKDVGRDGVNIGLGQQSFIYAIGRLYSRFIASDEDKPILPAIQVYGSNNLPDHKQHIASVFWSTPTILHRYRKGYGRTWMNKYKSTCGEDARDEYPYNKSEEGGESNYLKGRVSIKCVSSSESSLQGAFINTFYNYSPTPISDGEGFAVFPIGAASGYFDKRWKWHYFPGR